MPISMDPKKTPGMEGAGQLYARSSRGVNDKLWKDRYSLV